VSELSALEERHRLMKEVLSENLKKKLFIEINIGEQFEELKKLEIALEKIRAKEEGQMKCSESAMR
jgi:hypothetical protein